ncbi:MAG TPA: methyltransferase domain-containing protein [Candidatus Sulfotelmatobacter sp.]|nr:methyltransferase domain-containing protein [Candidatus Sulfotelmatobacter sp.]
MPSQPESKPGWGNQFRLVASEKWKAKSAAMGKPVTLALVEYAQPLPGMKVLDLASGTGEPAITLALRVGYTGQVTALDLSPDLLEIAAQRARDRNLTNFKTQQADAQSLPFPDQSFDLATSRFGVMFFPDPVLALRELGRVLRPGARACFLVWGSFDQPYWKSMMGIVHRHVGGPLLAPGGPDPFKFAAPGSLSEVLRSAGFTAIEEQTKTLPWAWPGSVEEVWEQAQAVAVPFRPMLERVPARQWPEINADVHAAVRQYWDGDKLSFGASVVLASGKK